jgi:hypothetical protein
MTVALAILLPVVLTATIQSLFGVGVLLFGTPLLLLLGYGFVKALTVLLPISVAINLLQIAVHRAHIDWALFKKVLAYTVPFIVLCLVLVTEWKINIYFLIGPFLLFVALKNFSPRIDLLLESLVRYERGYLVAMGVVHGLTNLGGALLTALVHSKNYDKDTTRVTTAIAYCTFALFQIATLVVRGKTGDIDYAEHGIYVATGIGVFLIVDRLVYTKIDNAKYKHFFAAFLFASGCLLIYKAVAQ